MKEQGKNLQDQINEEETGKLPEKECRIMKCRLSEIGWRHRLRKYKKQRSRTKEQTNRDEQHNN